MPGSGSKIAVFGALFAIAACGGEADMGENGSTSEASATQDGTSNEFPDLAERKSSGTLTGTIGDNSLDFEGVCSTSEGSFNFWSDGTDFASNSDVDGDGQYITVQAYDTGDGVMTALRFSKDGETVYNGQASYESFDGTTMTFDRQLGREQAMSADFTVDCE